MIRIRIRPSRKIGSRSEYQKTTRIRHYIQPCLLYLILPDPSYGTGFSQGSDPYSGSGFSSRVRSIFQIRFFLKGRIRNMDPVFLFNLVILIQLFKIVNHVF